MYRYIRSFEIIARTQFFRVIMTVSRRRFLELAGSAAAATALIPIANRTDALLVPASTVKTSQVTQLPAETVVHGVCAPNCWSGCKLLVHVRDGKLVATERGSLPDSRYDRICLRGLTHVQRVYHPDRLKYPMKRAGERGEGKWQRISWDEAINTIASKFTDVKNKYGSKAVAFLPGTGYYGSINGYYGSIFRFANLFAGTYGEGALDSAIPLGVYQVLGGPSYAQGNEAADLVNARLIILWGSNITESNLQNWHFVADALDDGGKLIVVDPRYTNAASKADLWVPIRPGADAALALSMMNVIFEESLYDASFVVARTVGPFLVKDDTQLFLREKDTAQGGSDKYMVWDSSVNAAVPFDKSSSSSLIGAYKPAGISCKTAFQILWDQTKQYRPEDTAKITDIQPETIRLLSANMRLASQRLSTGASGLIDTITLTSWVAASLH